MANLSQEERLRLLRNAIILRTEKFYEKGKLRDATESQLKMAAQILRRLGKKSAAVNAEVRAFRAKKKGFSPAYFAKAQQYRNEDGIPRRKGESRKKGVTGVVYLGGL